MNALPIRYGLIGHPVAHTRSPEIHRAFAEQAGIALDYVLIDATPDEFAGLIHEFFAAGGFGLNVTLPHKAAAFVLADEAGEEANRSSVANVLTHLPGERLRADNTDGIGFLRDLTVNLSFDPAGKRVLLLGAGGAAAGLLPTLLDAGVERIGIHNRNRERAQALIERFKDPRLCLADTAFDETPADLLINATSASLANECPEFPIEVAGADTLAYDLAYSSEPTPFMRRAAARGARTTDGWGMLVEQAAESFRIWHGIRPGTSSLLHHRLASSETTGSGLL